jgi:hypothetical protein
MSLSFNSTIEVKWNLEILGFDRGKKKVLHQRTHNIVVNAGRQFICEAISASVLSAGGFTRTQNHVVRYIGFGIGGTRQNNAAAASAPLSTAYPSGYGGTNAQTDTDVTVGRLERPVKYSSTHWLKEVVAPATYPDATTVRWESSFGQTEINIAPYDSVPLSEIGLYKSSADPTLPNGGAGTYPGPTGHMIAYDTFDTLNKTGFFTMVARWSWRL